MRLSMFTLVILVVQLLAISVSARQDAKPSSSISSSSSLSSSSSSSSSDIPAQDDVVSMLARSFGRQRDELETVRSLLSAHRENLGRQLSQLSTESSESNAEEELGISESSKYHTEEGGLDEDQVHRTAPTILQANKNLIDFLYQGDMALTVEQAKFLFSRRFRRQSLNGEKFPEYRWSLNISYSFDEKLEDDAKAIIKNALDFWANNTCLNFEENAKAPSRLAFTKANGCWSYVGKVSELNEPQLVSIGDGCEHFAVASHEIAHALGFFHAQSRYDRDNYVRFRVRNVASGFEDQFTKEGPETNNNYGVKYDYGSVLHYSDNAFAKTDRLPVLIANEKHNQNTMGQRIKPSFSDVLVMNRHYDCLSKCQKFTTKCKNGGYPYPKNCSKCICPWGFGGSSCSKRQASSGTVVPKKCGKTVQATASWSDLNATIGSTEKVLLSEHSACHFHIQAPKGHRVQLKLLAIGRVCSSGCFYGNTEFKISGDFARTGLRMCCASDVRSRPTLTSKTDLAVISLYTRFYLQTFRLQYRYV